jgi:hypothetical protein
VIYRNQLQSFPLARGSIQCISFSEVDCVPVEQGVIVAYGMWFLFYRSGGDYRLLFALGSCALLLALVVDLVLGAIGGRS